MIAGMRTIRIPPEWSQLYVGDRIHTAMPFHKIETTLQALLKDGFRFETEPSPRGYWVVCTKSPLVSPGAAKKDQPACAKKKRGVV